MDCKIVKKSAFDILEKVEMHSVVGGANVRSIPDFWDRAKTDGTEDCLWGIAEDKTLIFGVCYGEEDEKGDFEYSIAVKCASDAVAPEGYRKNTVPERTWAVFPCCGAMPTAIQNLWKRIFREYFPTSEYKPTGEMEIEAYADGDASAPDYYSEIWIPVCKK